MNRRLELHEKLCNIIGCPTTGNDCRVYFQSPSTVKMKYPAIVYALYDIENVFANNGVYFFMKKYSVTLIDSNPDTQYVDALTAIETSRFNRHYIEDNLNHFVFEIFY